MIQIRRQIQLRHDRHQVFFELVATRAAGPQHPDLKRAGQVFRNRFADEFFVFPEKGGRICLLGRGNDIVPSAEALHQFGLDLLVGPPCEFSCHSLQHLLQADDTDAVASYRNLGDFVFCHGSLRMSPDEVKLLFVGAASCRDVIVAGSHSHNTNRFPSLRWNGAARSNLVLHEK